MKAVESPVDHEANDARLTIDSKIIGSGALLGALTFERASMQLVDLDQQPARIKPETSHLSPAEAQWAAVGGAPNKGAVHCSDHGFFQDQGVEQLIGFAPFAAD